MASVEHKGKGGGSGKYEERRCEDVAVDHYLNHALAFDATKKIQKTSKKLKIELCPFAAFLMKYSQITKSPGFNPILQP